MTTTDRSFWSLFWRWLTSPPRPPALPPVSPPAPVLGKSRLYSVGINAYPGAELHGCVNDSNHMAEYLGGKGFEVHQLLDAAATGPAMESFWREGVARTGPNDFLVIHDSGHGSNGPSGLPTDPAQCLVSVELRPFYASRLGQILDGLDPEGMCAVLLDCCHSETGTRAFRGWWEAIPYHAPKFIPWSMLDTSQDPVPSLAHSRIFGLTALARSPRVPMVEFAACQANDVTYDADINNVLQGNATRTWLDAAMELDRELPQGYTVQQFQDRVRTKLPSPEFPNQPQLQAAEDQKLLRMWTP